METKTKLGIGFQQGKCPKCGSNWDGGSIVESFIKQREDGVKFYQGKSDEDIRLMVEGWTHGDVVNFLDRITDEQLLEALLKVADSPFGTHWVKRNFSNLFESYTIKDIRIRLESMHVNELETFMHGAFGVSCSGSYGPPYRWSHLIGIEIQGMYDGISYWRCPSCETTWNRWTLMEEEIQEVPTRPDFSLKGV